MRQVYKKPIKQVAKSTTKPAPFSGLNARDPLVAMDPSFAVTLKNFVVQPYGMAVRKGYKEHVTGITGYVETLMPYNAQSDANRRLFAAAGSKIYNASSLGDSTPDEEVTGLSSALWSYVNFATPGNHYLVAVNGSNEGRLYNGSSWTAFSTVATPSSPGEISGGSSSDWTQIATHQKRLWFVKATSTQAQYLPINSVGGAVKTLDYASLFTDGGHLVALSSWTMDGGNGIDDHLVAISSTGDLVVFAGSDPEYASSWQLIGRYKISPPVGNRCFLEFGGDLLVLTTNGVLELSKVIQTRQTDSSLALTDNIKVSLLQQIRNYKSLTAWDMCFYPGHDLLLINVPQPSQDENTQYVYNSIMKGWSVFEGYPAQCFVVYNDNLYFGGNGKVYHGFDGWRDGANSAGTGGNPYTARAQTAFDYFEKPGQMKTFQMVRPTLISTGTPVVDTWCNIDFKFDESVASSYSFGVIDGARFDTDKWDVGRWGGSTNTYRYWQNVSGIGVAGSLSISITADSETYWAATEWIYQVGGIFG